MLPGRTRMHGRGLVRQGGVHLVEEPVGVGRQQHGCHRRGRLALTAGGGRRGARPGTGTARRVRPRWPAAGGRRSADPRSALQRRPIGVSPRSAGTGRVGSLGTEARARSAACSRSRSKRRVTTRSAARSGSSTRTPSASSGRCSPTLRGISRLVIDLSEVPFMDSAGPRRAHRWHPPGPRGRRRGRGRLWPPNAHPPAAHHRVRSDRPGGREPRRRPRGAVRIRSPVGPSRRRRQGCIAARTAAPPRPLPLEHQAAQVIQARPDRGCRWSRSGTRTTGC